jgi:hypothetical protein
MKQVKYPFSNLKKHHYCYMNLLCDFLKTMYDVRFYLKGEETKIKIEIHDVQISPVYNPFDFNVCYRVLDFCSGEYILISEYDFFKTFYSYLPDIVPYLEFELYLSDSENKPFKTFDLKNLYYCEMTTSDNCFTNVGFIDG